MTFLCVFLTFSISICYNEVDAYYVATLYVMEKDAVVSWLRNTMFVLAIPRVLAILGSHGATQQFRDSPSQRDL